MLPESIKVKHRNWSKAGVQLHGLIGTLETDNHWTAICSRAVRADSLSFDGQHLLVLRLISTSSWSVRWLFRNFALLNEFHWANFTEPDRDNQLEILWIGSLIVVHRRSCMTYMDAITRRNLLLSLCGLSKLIFYSSNRVFDENFRPSSSSMIQQDRSIVRVLTSESSALRALVKNFEMAKIAGFISWMVTVSIHSNKLQADKFLTNFF